MLELKIEGREFYDEETSSFVMLTSQTLQLEHSLLSISKWESKWHKPFLSREARTPEEAKYYVKCMTINKNVDPIVYESLSNEDIDKINKYIEDPMTATWFKEDQKRGSSRIITNELVYCWMAALQIPFECEKWHINRLLTLIRVCNEENAPKKTMSKKDTAAMYRSINAARRQKRHAK